MVSQCTFTSEEILTVPHIQSEDHSFWDIQAPAISGDAGSRQQPTIYPDIISFGWPEQLAGSMFFLYT